MLGEAARATHDTLPLLIQADEVILAEVVPQHPPARERYTIPIEAMAAR